MNVAGGLKRIWLVGTIAWTIVVPLYVAWEIHKGVQSTYEVAYYAADQTCRQMRDAPRDCFAIEHAKNVSKYGDRFDSRFARIFLNDGFWSAIYWLFFLIASISVPSAIAYGFGAVVVWIGRGFKAS